jgi:cell division protein FtsI (penicillin-binding protein 3)
MNQNRAHVRMLLVAGVALFWFIAVFARLGYLQLYRHLDYLAKAQRQQQRVIEITPKRGAIYDRNMHPLAMSIPVDSAYAVPAEMADESMAARFMSGVLGIPREVLEARLVSSRSFVWIARKLSPDKREALEALGLKGIYFQKENQRIYPKRDLASHVLGFVDMDEKGLGGVEYGLDSQIRGRSEKIMVMADARQHWFDGGVAPRESGANVVLTLDEKIQYIAERELYAAIAKTHAINGTVVVMNPNTGEILAMANWPKFNPNAPAGAPAEARINRADYPGGGFRSANHADKRSL